VKGVPFKFSFFLWRLWVKKYPLGKFLSRLKWWMKLSVVVVIVHKMKLLNIFLWRALSLRSCGILLLVLLMCSVLFCSLTILYINGGVRTARQSLDLSSKLSRHLSLGKFGKGEILFIMEVIYHFMVWLWRSTKIYII